MRVQLALVLICGAATSYAGLLGAGTGHGSCAAFPFRADDLDHVGGCPRYAECCTEFGYCHSKDSWEAGYFRDCNGKSNGQPLPGSVIRLEAAESAKRESQVTAQVLGISQEIWQSQVQKAVSILTSSTSSTSSSSSSSSSSSGQSSFTGSSISSGSSGSFSSSDLVQQIILAIQPQIAQIVQSAVSTQSTVTSELVSNDISSVNNQESFQSFSGSSQFGSSGSSQFGSTGSSQLGSSGSSQFGSSGSSQLGSSGSSQFGSSGSSQFGTSGSSQFGSSGGSQFGSGSRFDATNDISSTLNQESQTLNTNSQLVNSLDVSQLVSLVLAALTPQITAAVQSAAV